MENKKYNTILELCQEIDYQKEYSYEQRVDIFNKYFLSVSTKYINPLMLLTTHIRKYGNRYYQHSPERYHGMSHSGYVQTAFNREVKEGKSKYVKITNNTRFNTYKVFNYDYSSKGMKEVMLFHEKIENGEVKFKIYNMEDFFPDRGFCFYEWAEEFCKDFGFNVKFIQ